MLSTTSGSCFGFVVDRRGATGELDWDSIMAGTPIRIEPLPDRLGMLARHLPVHPELRPGEAARDGDLAVFRGLR